MSKQPSKIIFDILSRHKSGMIPLEDLPDIFKHVASQFQLEEAEACKSIQILSRMFFKSIKGDE